MKIWDKLAFASFSFYLLIVIKMFSIIQKYLYDKENLTYVLDYLIDYKEKNNKKFNIDKAKNYLINLYIKKQNNELTKTKINDKINKLLYYITYDF